MKLRIKEVMVRTFGLSDVSQIADDACVERMAEWDSVAHLMLMLDLESEFGIKISTDVMSELDSLEAIEQFVATSQAT